MMSEEQTILKLNIQAQPDDVTCGPTCLHAVYNYYGGNDGLHEVINRVRQLKSGGTLAVLLGIDALNNGYNAEIYTYNLHMFDPSWFENKIDLPKKLKEQMRYKRGRKFLFAAESYLKFLEMGGKIKFEDLKSSLVKRYLSKNTPILTGLSATYLYNSQREIEENNTFDDIRGTPAGHFVVINGYKPKTREVYIADPLATNPMSDKQHYTVNIQRLLNSIMLGIVTYDANLLIINPKKQKYAH